MKKVSIETKMRNLIKYNLIILFCFYQNVLAIENKILFKIDDELITSIDIYNKSKYLSALDPDIKNLSQEEIFECLAIDHKTFLWTFPTTLFPHKNVN